jgi:hypothetical protein
MTTFTCKVCGQQKQDTNVVRNDVAAVCTECIWKAFTPHTVEDQIIEEAIATAANVKPEHQAQHPTRYYTTRNLWDCALTNVGKIKALRACNLQAKLCEKQWQELPELAQQLLAKYWYEELKQQLGDLGHSRQHRETD